MDAFKKTSFVLFGCVPDAQTVENSTSSTKAKGLLCLMSPYRKTMHSMHDHFQVCLSTPGYIWCCVSLSEAGFALGGDSVKLHSLFTKTFCS